MAQPYSYSTGGYPYQRPPVTKGARFYTQQSVKFQRYQDDQGYHLRIATQGYTPEAIMVKIDGPYLVVENQESHRVESRHERGYSFTRSSSSMRRRFRLPWNADGAAMKRSQEDGVIVITLPYR
jgi:HSP20 family molecular chaperone IbpA